MGFVFVRHAFISLDEQKQTPQDVCGEANLEDDKKDMYVVVKFYSWIKCNFPLFWAVVVYDNELK